MTKRDLSRALLVATVAAWAALVAGDTSNCRARAQTPMPVEPVEEPATTNEAVLDPQDPCNWSDVPYLIRILMGCPEPSGGGESGAG